eukprot:TRINITY_DN16001_c0_g1_i1.p1 TRINITY_DN16001_c0_g1~~TRINITY_DN16001_c0_g1_i1.p1  ORF type:complete len:376 (+),score=120.39 TRINITY_DN16001_c0_g1_i1:38-1129(+)
MKRGMTMGQKMILWIKQKLKDDLFSDLQFVNLTESFQDGLILLAMIHVFSPQHYDYNTVNKNNKLENVRKAVSILEEEWNIPRIISPEDIHENSDDKSMQLFLSYVIKQAQEYEKLNPSGTSTETTKKETTTTTTTPKTTTTTPSKTTSYSSTRTSNTPTTSSNTTSTTTPITSSNTIMGMFASRSHNTFGNNSGSTTAPTTSTTTSHGSSSNVVNANNPPKEEVKSENLEEPSTEPKTQVVKKVVKKVVTRVVKKDSNGNTISSTTSSTTVPKTTTSTPTTTTTPKTTSSTSITPSTNTTSSNSKYLTIDYLRTKPYGVDLTLIDQLLSPKDFEEVFGISCDKWKDVPAWQKTAKRKQAGLF